VRRAKGQWFESPANCLAKKPDFTGFRGAAAAGRAAGAQWVPGDANAPADCTYEKDLQTQVFRERLKGFEPSTFCMASRTCGADPTRICLQTGDFWAPGADEGFPAFTGRSRGFG
jgi:hypothetical protein